MKIRLCLFAGSASAIVTTLTAGTVELAPKQAPPPSITQSEPWQFVLAVPGLMPGINGTVGVRGVNANIDIGFDQILEHLDMLFALRGEARKGPFGIFGEILYTGLSDDTQINGLINNVHEQVDQTLVDVGLSWRLVNQPRGFIDFAAGTHYANVYERLELHSDPALIQQTSGQFVDDITPALRNKLNEDLTEDGLATATAQFANAVTAALRNRLNEKISSPQLINSLTNSVRTDITTVLRDFLSERISKEEFVNSLTRQIRTDISTALRNRLREDASKELVGALTNGIRTDITTALRDRLTQHLSDDAFVTALTTAIRTDITTAFRDQDIFSKAIDNAIQKHIINRLGDKLQQHQRKPNIPIGPLGGHIRRDIGHIVEDLVQTKANALRARIDALHLKGEARRAAVNRILAAAQSQITHDLALTLNSKLSETLSRDDYWFDPYVGLHTRYNFNKTFYTAVRGEIGGFGVGADLMWEVEATLGINLTHSIFTEVGYRALGVDYNNDGLLFDAVMHGPQITTGVTF
ncbi:MAG: hypothetical protein ACM3NN_09850 [Nitrospirota bacterium]|jgi:hypothetical protein